MYSLTQLYKGKGESIPVLGREVPYGCETSTLPHFLENRPAEDREFFSLTRRPPFNPRKIPDIDFC
jgi:hypothetical protein